MQLQFDENMVGEMIKDIVRIEIIVNINLKHLKCGTMLWDSKPASLFTPNFFSVLFFSKPLWIFLGSWETYFFTKRAPDKVKMMECSENHEDYMETLCECEQKYEDHQQGFQIFARKWESRLSGD